MDPRGDLRDPTLRGPLRPPPGQHSHRGAMHGATGPPRMQRGASHVAAAHCSGARDGVRVSQNIGRRCGGGCKKSANGRRPERSLTSECLKRARRPPDTREPAVHRRHCGQDLVPGTQAGSTCCNGSGARAPWRPQANCDERRPERVERLKNDAGLRRGSPRKFGSVS